MRCPACAECWVRVNPCRHGQATPAYFQNASPAPRPAHGKSTGCARARGVSYKTKGNTVLRGATGRHHSCQDPKPKASQGRGCRMGGREAGSAGTQAQFKYPDIQHSF